MNLRDRKWDPDKDDAEALWGRLNDAWRDLREAMRAIPRISFYERSFTGPVASFTAGEINGGTRPRGVLLIDLVNIDAGGTAAVTWSWSWADGTLTTTSFSGVAAGTYRMRLLVLGGS